MTIDEIKELIQLVNESGIDEIEVQRGADRVRIRRHAPPSTQELVIPHLAGSIPVVASSSAPTGTGHAAVAAPNVKEDEQNLVKSPIVGTYYDAPSPGAPSFVKVGDVIEPGQVLCVIESMKLMNEIEAEIAGTVIAKLVENGRPVEYGEALFSIKPR